MASENFVAIDLGAESGRAVVGSLMDGKLSLDEVHRFPNRPVYVAGHLHWDVLRLYDEILNGCRIAAGKVHSINSLGIDTWGVDFGLIDKTGELVGLPYHYRDQRTEGMLEKVFECVPRPEVFAATGIQFMRLNTLYQLYALKLSGSAALEMADRLLMMPDLLNYWLTGEKVSEYTIATTTQFYDTRQNAWAEGLLARLGLPTRILPPVVQPGTMLGRLLSHPAEQTGLKDVRVIAPACHDTGSAVAAIPARIEDYAYISSGTWSLMGVVSPQPVVTDRTLEYNFTNEGGVDGTIRLLKNIAGLWLVQECRRAWANQGQELGYDAITALADKARPFQAFVNPNDPMFISPPDMPQALRDYCITTRQNTPGDQGSLVRVALESLACSYRQTLEMLEEITGRRLNVIHIVGGGSQNRLLCQLAANACERPVYAGPVETTALGNILAQAVADGCCGSWEEGREIVRNSFPLTVYEPRDSDLWREAYGRYQKVIEMR